MKLISHDLQDGGKLPNRHVFNGMATMATIFRRI